jgi:Protein of unknown function (DUF2997)
MSKKIIAKINKKTGALTITTEGYAGADCLKATEELEKGLGMNQGCSVPTQEMYNVEKNEQQVGGS